MIKKINEFLGLVLSITACLAIAENTAGGLNDPLCADPNSQTINEASGMIACEYSSLHGNSVNSMNSGIGIQSNSPENILCANGLVSNSDGVNKRIICQQDGVVNNSALPSFSSAPTSFNGLATNSALVECPSHLNKVENSVNGMIECK